MNEFKNVFSCVNFLLILLCNFLISIFSHVQHFLLLSITERSEEHYDDYSSTSFYDLSNSSLSLFSISAFGVIDRSLATEMVQEKMAAQAKDRRFRGISRVKRATKSVAKKLNRILLRTKTKLKTQKTAAATNAALNEIFGLEQPIDDNDIGIIRSERVDDDIDMIENERIADPTAVAVAVANDNVTEVDLNKTSTSSLHFIESSPFAVDECEWQITEDDNGDSCIGSSYEDCLSSIGSSPSLDQSPCDKSSYGSLEECMSSDAPSLVSIIINRSQSRSPIVFRPDFYVKKTGTTADTPNGQPHKQHTLYQVSNDNHSAIDDYTSLIERINARKQQIESDLKIESEIKTKSKKLSQIISKLGAPSKYTRKLSSIIWSANIINVTQKFLNYVSIV